MELILKLLDCKAENTKRSYLTAKDQWGAFSVTPFYKALLSDVLDFIKLLRQNNKAPNTIRLRLHALATMRELYVVMDLARGNPFEAAIKFAGLERSNPIRETKCFESEQVAEMLMQADLTTARGSQDAAMLALSFACALRRSELVGLNRGDVQGRMLVIRATKTKMRVKKPVNDWAWSYLQRHLDFRMCQEDGDPLFLSNKGRMSTRQWYRVFKAFCKTIGVYDAAPHSSRATAATELLMKGCDYGQVARQLGHSGVHQVMTYDKRRLGSAIETADKLTF